MVKGAFALCGIGQTISAKVFTAEVGFAVLGGRLIRLEDEFVVLQSGCKEKTVMQNTKNETMKPMGYGG
jgi:hypothetical protein